MNRIVHCKREPYDIYIGRANKDLPHSKWANPFIIGKDGTRAEVIAKYEAWIKTQPHLIAALSELKDKTLGCWCAPFHDCHGRVLSNLIEQMTDNNKRNIEQMTDNNKRNILPLWSTHYSIGESILTVEEAGKTKPGNPASICDIAKRDGLKQITIVDSKIDGFLEAQRHLSKIDVQLLFGLKIVVCDDMNMKDDNSLATESKVIIFAKNTQGYKDLIKISNRAWTEGFYYQGRTDWKSLKALWTDNLVLALPFFSSFIAANLLTMKTIVPDLPVRPWVFKEVESNIPFAPLIEEAITKFAADNQYDIQETKSIYYEKPEDMETYVTFRAINERNGSFGAPRVDHLCSDRFSYAEWKRLTEETV